MAGQQRLLSDDERRVACIDVAASTPDGTSEERAGHQADLRRESSVEFHARLVGYLESAPVAAAQDAHPMNAAGWTIAIIGIVIALVIAWRWEQSTAIAPARHAERSNLTRS